MHAVVDLSLIQTVSRILYRPSFVTDGNFKLQHLAMRRPDDDVFLRDGQGHMVGREPYRTHIETTTEQYQVSLSSILNGRMHTYRLH